VHGAAKWSSHKHFLGMFACTSRAVPKEKPRGLRSNSL
jgi:hypothetical protein